jgi:cell division septation protein DedD
VRKHFFVTIIFIFGVILSLIGCVSSEETGAGDRAKSPVQIFGPIDTTHHLAHRESNRDTISKPKIDSTKLVITKRPRVASKFKSKQDTVRVSIVKKSKSYSRSYNKMIRSEHPTFTVQIGAFKKASNALQAQKRAKERFVDQPVFNNFFKSDKLYRVSIGRYEDRKSAFAFADTVKEQFPVEYQKCWINFIP